MIIDKVKAVLFGGTGVVGIELVQATNVQEAVPTDIPIGSEFEVVIKLALQAIVAIASIIVIFKKKKTTI